MRMCTFDKKCLLEKFRLGFHFLKWLFELWATKKNASSNIYSNVFHHWSKTWAWLLKTRQRWRAWLRTITEPCPTLASVITTSRVNMTRGRPGSERDSPSTFMTLVTRYQLLSESTPSLTCVSSISEQIFSQWNKYYNCCSSNAIP